MCPYEDKYDYWHVAEPRILFVYYTCQLKENCKLFTLRVLRADRLGDVILWRVPWTPRLGWQASAINGSPPALPARGKWCIALLIEVCKRGVLMYVPSEEESTATVAIPFSSCIFMTIFTAQPWWTTPLDGRGPGID